MDTAWSQNEELFIRLLKEGREYEEYVAERLREAGINDVRVPDLKIRKHIREAGEYADQVDIYVGPEQNPARIEVKSSSRSFTTPGDIPSFMIPLFLTTVGSWEGARVKPHVFAIVSQPTGAILTVSSATYKDWAIVNMKDRMRGMKDRTLAAPRHHIKPFSTLAEALMRREKRLSP